MGLLTLQLILDCHRAFCFGEVCWWRGDVFYAENLEVNSVDGDRREWWGGQLQADYFLSGIANSEGWLCILGKWEERLSKMETWLMEQFALVFFALSLPCLCPASAL